MVVYTKRRRGALRNELPSFYFDLAFLKKVTIYAESDEN